MSIDNKSTIQAAIQLDVSAYPEFSVELPDELAEMEDSESIMVPLGEGEGVMLQCGYTRFFYWTRLKTMRMRMTTKNRLCVGPSMHRLRKCCPSTLSSRQARQSSTIFSCL